MTQRKKKFKPHHITATEADFVGNGGVGRYVLLPGSDGRAKVIAERFQDVTVRESDRGHNVYLGTLQGHGGPVDVAAVASGMGCPSLDIIVTECIKLGASRFLRVGTSGSLQPDVIRPPSLVLATGAVRDEGTSRNYAPLEVPALASLEWIRAIETAAGNLGIDGEVYAGPVHSKDSLFAREFHQGPMAEENVRYMERLAALGVLASEMEAAHLFVLGAVHGNPIAPLADKEERREGILTGCILAVIGDHKRFASKTIQAKAVSTAIDLALEAIRVLAVSEGAATVH
ncbi:MAG: nucleoside phosphorylase [Pseudomonadota bacterium]